MSIAAKLQTIAENVSKVYEQGEKDSPAHDLLKSLVARTISEFVIPDDWFIGTNAFSYTKITRITVPAGVRLDGNYGASFGNMKALEEVDWYRFSWQAYAFAGCDKLKTLRMHNRITTMYNYFLANCTSLENYLYLSTIKIHNNNFDVTKCTKLTVESLLSILNACEDNTGGTTYTVKLGATNLAKLTDEQKAIATNKNIELA